MARMPQRRRRRKAGPDPFLAVFGLAGLVLAGHILKSARGGTGGLVDALKSSAIPIGLAGLAIIGGLALWIYLQRLRGKAYREALLKMGARDPLALSPIEYEKFCAILLEKRGWRTETTRASGDFGADIIARRGNEVMVVQCKRYSKPVGVKAVQEAHTAASFYGAGRTAVMACRGFTRAAHALAGKTGTALVQVGESDASAFR